MSRLFVFHVLCSAVVSVFVYRTATMPTSSKAKQNSVSLFDVATPEISTLLYKNGERRVLVTSSSRFHWLVETGDQVFPAGKSFARDIEQSFPLVAERSLGVVNDEQKLAMGLQDGGATLEVRTTDGHTTIFSMGSVAFGGRSRYFGAGTQGYLVEGKPWKKWGQDPVGLSSKVLLQGAPSSFLSMRVQMGESVAAFVHQNHEDGKESFWTRAEASSADATLEVTAAEDIARGLRTMRVTRFAQYETVCDGPDVLEFSVVLDKGRTSQGQMRLCGDGEPAVVVMGALRAYVDKTAAEALLRDVGEALLR